MNDARRALAPSATGGGLASRWRLTVQVSHGTSRGWVRCMLSQFEFVMGWLRQFTQPDARQVRRLVFVCLGNINRSAFAAAVARRRGAAAVSIGLSTSTGAPATPQAMRFATDFDVSLEAHAATDISEYDFEPGDLLLVMETRHARRLVNRGMPPAAIALLGHWSSPHRIHLHDPQTLSDAYYRTCFALIQSAVSKLTDEFAAGGSPCMRRPAPSQVAR